MSKVEKTDASGSMKIHPSTGIPLLKSVRDLRGLQHDPLAFFSALPQQYGDIVQVKLFFWPVVIINHPDYIRRVLQENYQNYTKNVPIFTVFKPLLGNGLVTNYGGEDWLQQRRLMQPAFHRQHLADLGKLVTDATQTLCERWERLMVEGQSFDIVQEMLHLTLTIVSQALFHCDIADRASAFGQAFSQVNAALIEYFNHPFPPLSVPTPAHRRFRAALRMLDALAYDIIRQRRVSKQEHTDLLALLMQARDEETGEGMSDQQLRDEIMTLLVAGHETVANALVWSWYLLAQHPDSDQKMYTEIVQELGEHPPTLDALPRLPYVRQVFEETMRLYPPVWIIMRKAIEADQLGPYRLPPRSYVLWSTYALHRHPDFWERPEVFEPERFAPDRVAARPRHAYIPFSHGPRMCIGNHFALTEAHLILLTIAQRFRLVLAPGQRIEPEPLMTLGPRTRIQMYAQRR